MTDSLAAVEAASAAVDSALVADGRSDLYEVITASNVSADYVEDDADHVWERRVVPLPDALLESYAHDECTVFMGVFAEIGRAWISIDNRLYLWNYESGDDFCVYDSLDQVIVSVGLVRAKADVFVDEIGHVLVVATPVEVHLLAVSVAGRSVTGQLTLHATGLRVPTDSTTMLCVRGTSDGRIFLAGRDGALHELEYGREKSFFDAFARRDEHGDYDQRPVKCRKVNRTSTPLSFLVPQFVRYWLGAEDDPLLALDTDVTSDTLYTLSLGGEVRVYSVAPPRGLAATRAARSSAAAGGSTTGSVAPRLVATRSPRIIARDYEQAGGQWRAPRQTGAQAVNADAASRALIVSVHALSAGGAHRAAFVLVARCGARLYYGGQPLRLLHVRHAPQHETRFSTTGAGAHASSPSRHLRHALQARCATHAEGVWAVGGRCDSGTGGGSSSSSAGASSRAVAASAANDGGGDELLWVAVPAGADLAFPPADGAGERDERQQSLLHLRHRAQQHQRAPPFCERVCVLPLSAPAFYAQLLRPNAGATAGRQQLLLAVLTGAALVSFRLRGSCEQLRLALRADAGVDTGTPPAGGRYAQRDERPRIGRHVEQLLQQWGVVALCSALFAVSARVCGCNAPCPMHVGDGGKSVSSAAAALLSALGGRARMQETGDGRNGMVNGGGGAPSADAGMGRVLLSSPLLVHSPAFDGLAALIASMLRPVWDVPALAGKGGARVAATWSRLAGELQRLRGALVAANGSVSGNGGEGAGGRTLGGDALGLVPLVAAARDERRRAEAERAAHAERDGGVGVRTVLGSTLLSGVAPAVREEARAVSELISLLDRVGELCALLAVLCSSTGGRSGNAPAAGGGSLLERVCKVMREERGVDEQQHLTLRVLASTSRGETAVSALVSSLGSLAASGDADAEAAAAEATRRCTHLFDDGARVLLQARKMLESAAWGADSVLDDADRFAAAEDACARLLASPSALQSAPLELLVSPLLFLRRYPALVSLALALAKLRDPRDLAWSVHSGQDDTLHDEELQTEARRKHEQRAALYDIALSAVQHALDDSREPAAAQLGAGNAPDHMHVTSGSLLAGRDEARWRRAVRPRPVAAPLQQCLAVALSSKFQRDRMWHYVLYDFMLRGALDDGDAGDRDDLSSIVLGWDTPYIEQHLREVSMPLYSRWLVRHGRWVDAAALLARLAQERPGDGAGVVSLERRVEFLSQAKACLAERGADQRAAELADTVEALLDVAMCQLYVRDALRERHAQLSERALARIAELDDSLLSLSDLFNRFAVPFDLFESQLRCLHCASRGDDSAACHSNEDIDKSVRRAWLRVLDAAEERGGRAALEHTLLSLGRALHPSRALPLDHLLSLLSDRTALDEQRWVATVLHRIGLAHGELAAAAARAVVRAESVPGAAVVARCALLHAAVTQWLDTGARADALRRHRVGTAIDSALVALSGASPAAAADEWRRMRRGGEAVHESYWREAIRLWSERLRALRAKL